MTSGPLVLGLTRSPLASLSHSLSLAQVVDAIQLISDIFIYTRRIDLRHIHLYNSTREREILPVGGV